MRVGVEVGGTFTDLVAIDGDEIRISKVPSTPAHPDEGALDALEKARIPLERVDDLVHGSTVATNAILERKGARTLFVTTKGFRDLLLLQRHNRRSIYDLKYRKPVPVVSRRDTIEVDERMSSSGEPIRQLDDAAVREQLHAVLSREEYASVAICFLNSYANPGHERRVAALLREAFPDVAITCSADVTGEFREYERASTTTLSAYVRPVIDRYLSRFEQKLAKSGFHGHFSVMQSNGGRVPATGMAESAITSLFSGPAAGVMGAVRQAGLSGYRNLITLDMGGTSTDVCLVADGAPALSSETEVDGLPIRTPVLDIVTVGAGGGSIIWRDDGGLLRIGPESAGADPGPACYGRGGATATITDAHMVRGTLRPEAFLGGKMTVDRDASEKALAVLAEAFGTDIPSLADDALRVADHNIVRAIQLVSTERGRDPRDYVLVPFGGAGPLHAARVAEELNVDTLVVAPNAGVLSAYGLLASDYARYDTRTRRTPVNGENGDAGTVIRSVVRSMFEEMEAEARDAFAAFGVSQPLRFTHIVDMRYVGQAFEVPVALDDTVLDDLTEVRLLDLFNDAHHRVFEFDDSRVNRAEIVSFRLGASSAQRSIPTLRESEAPVSGGETTIFDHGRELTVRFMNRGSFRMGEPLSGPVLVEDETSTVYVPDGWSVRLDEHDNLVVER